MLFSGLLLATYQTLLNHSMCPQGEQSHPSFQDRHQHHTSQHNMFLSPQLCCLHSVYSLKHYTHTRNVLSSMPDFGEEGEGLSYVFMTLED